MPPAAVTGQARMNRGPLSGYRQAGPDDCGKSGEAPEILVPEAGATLAPREKVGTLLPAVHHGEHVADHGDGRRPDEDHEDAGEDEQHERED